MARPPLAARLVGGAFQELSLSGASFGPTDRFGDVAAIPGTSDAFATVVPFADRHSVQQQGDGGADRGRRDGPPPHACRPPARAAAAPRGSPAPRPTTAGWPPGPAGSSTTATARRCRSTPTPPSQGTIDVPAQRVGRTVHPRRRCPPTTRSSSPRRRSNVEKTPKATQTARAPPAAAAEAGALAPARACVLTVSFTVTRRARVQLLAKRGGRIVARTPRRVFCPRPPRAEPAPQPRALPDEPHLQDQGGQAVSGPALARRHARRRGVCRPLARRRWWRADRRRREDRRRPPPPVGPLPLLGSGRLRNDPDGSGARGGPGEAWGYRAAATLGRQASAVGSRQLRLRAAVRPHSPQPAAARLPALHRRRRLAGLRHAGRPERAIPTAGRPRTGSRRGSRRAGGGVLVGRDSSRPSDDQVGRARPRSGRQLARAGRTAARTCCCRPKRAAGRGAGGRPRLRRDRRRRLRRRRATPASSSLRRAAPSPTAIIHFDGSDWSREPSRSPRRLGVEVPHPRDRRHRARQRLGDRRSRTSRSAAPWSCSSGPSRRRAAPGLGRARPRRDAVRRPRHARRRGSPELAPIGGAAQPLTVTPDGVWIDLTATIDGARHDVDPLLRHRRRRGHRLLVRRARSATLRSASKLSRQRGYRSFAWPGQRVRHPHRHQPARPGRRRGHQPRHLSALRRRAVRADAGRRRELPRQRGLRQRRQRLAGGTGRDLGEVGAAGRLRPWPISAAGSADRRHRARRGRRRARSALGRSRSGSTASVARYIPGRGWQREFLLSSSGARQQGDPARRRLAGTDARATPSATSARCGSGTPTTASGSPTRGSRSASKAT